MGDSISANALAHIKSLMADKSNIASQINQWRIAEIKNQAALDAFLKFLDLEHSLGPQDQVNPDTGIITRAPTG